MTLETNITSRVDGHVVETTAVVEFTHYKGTPGTPAEIHIVQVYDKITAHEIEELSDADRKRIEQELWAVIDAKP